MDKSIRLAGPALAAVVALLAAGCGSDGDSDGGGDGKDEKPDAEQTDPSDADGAEDPATGEGLDSAYHGVWASDSGEALLRLGGDRIATLVLETGLCVGAASETAGQTMITVQCDEASADADYTVGRATVDGQALTVAWEGAGEHAYSWLADVDVDLAELDLSELNLDFEGFDPSQLDLEGLDLSELEKMLPPGSGDVDFGSD
jgi:hypothetical protein